MQTSRALIIVFFTVGLGALASALTKLDSILWNQWAFAAFYILFRLKMFLDDLHEFRAHHESSGLAQINFGFGILAWIFWIASATVVGDFKVVPFYLICALGISTLWLSIETAQESFKKDKTEEELADQERHFFWIAVNLYFIAWLLPLAFRGTDTNGSGIVFVLFSVLVLLDTVCSQSLKVFQNGSSTGHGKVDELDAESLKTVLTVFLTIGLSAVASSLHKIQFPSWIFAFFLVLLRVKIFLDQRGYYKSAVKGSFQFEGAFFLGLVSWALWFAAALVIRDLDISIALLICALCSSSLSLFIRRTTSPNEKRNEHIPKWFYFNLTTVILLTCAFFIGGKALTWIPIALCALVIYNFYKSKSLSALDT